LISKTFDLMFFHRWMKILHWRRWTMQCNNISAELRHIRDWHNLGRHNCFSYFFIISANVKLFAWKNLYPPKNHLYYDRLCIWWWDICPSSEIIFKIYGQNWTVVRQNESGSYFANALRLQFLMVSIKIYLSNQHEISQVVARWKCYPR
jgi:hypothetical protein